MRVKIICYNNDNVSSKNFQERITRQSTEKYWWIMQQKINAEKFEGPKMADILGHFYFNNHWSTEKSPEMLIGKNGSKTVILKVDSNAPVSGIDDEIEGGKNENSQCLFVSWFTLSGQHDQSSDICRGL